MQYKPRCQRVLLTDRGQKYIQRMYNLGFDFIAFRGGSLLPVEPRDSFSSPRKMQSVFPMGRGRQKLALCQGINSRGERGMDSDGDTWNLYYLKVYKTLASEAMREDSPSCQNSSKGIGAK